MPRAKTESAGERAAREHVEEARAACPAPGRRSRASTARVDPRGGDVRTDAVDRQQRQREEDSPLELRDLGDVPETANHARLRPSRRPPRSSRGPTRLNAVTFTVRGCLQLALRQDLDAGADVRDQPGRPERLRRRPRCPPRSRARSRRFTTAYSVLKRLVKPRLGSGAAAASGRPRSPAPWCRRSASPGPCGRGRGLAVAGAVPRPIRLRPVREPLAGFRSDRFI